MGSLPCPKCESVPVNWITDTMDEDLLETGIMECENCKAQFIGIPGWRQAWEDAGRPF